MVILSDVITTSDTSPLSSIFINSLYFISVRRCAVIAESKRLSRSVAATEITINIIIGLRNGEPLPSDPFLCLLSFIAIEKYSFPTQCNTFGSKFQHDFSDFMPFLPFIHTKFINGAYKAAKLH